MALGAFVGPSLLLGFGITQIIINDAAKGILGFISGFGLFRSRVLAGSDFTENLLCN